jgi:hypothetical protein
MAAFSTRVPTEEAVSLFGGATGKEVHGGDPILSISPGTLRDAAASLESLGSEKLRLPGCFPHGNEDRKDADGHLVSLDQNLLRDL